MNYCIPYPFWMWYNVLGNYSDSNTSLSVSIIKIKINGYEYCESTCSSQEIQNADILQPQSGGPQPLVEQFSFEQLHSDNLCWTTMAILSTFMVRHPLCMNGWMCTSMLEDVKTGLNCWSYTMGVAGLGISNRYLFLAQLLKCLGSFNQPS